MSDADEPELITLQFVDEDGNPIAGAIVRLPDGREGVTDSQGRVTFEKLGREPLEAVIEYGGKTKTVVVNLDGERVVTVIEDDNKMAAIILAIVGMVVALGIGSWIFLKIRPTQDRQEKKKN